MKIFLFCFCMAFWCFLTGCETMEAISTGEVVGKTSPSQYSYSVPDRYRAGFKPEK